MPINDQPGMLMSCSVIHLDTVFAGTSHDLAAVELQGSHRVLEAMYFGDIACANVPDLSVS